MVGDVWMLTLSESRGTYRIVYPILGVLSLRTPVRPLGRVSLVRHPRGKSSVDGYDPAMKV